MSDLLSSVLLSRFFPFLFPRLHVHIKEASPPLCLILGPLRISLMTLQLAFKITQRSPEIVSPQPGPSHCAGVVVLGLKLQGRSQPWRRLDPLPCHRCLLAASMLSEKHLKRPELNMDISLDKTGCKLGASKFCCMMCSLALAPAVKLTEYGQN